MLRLSRKGTFLQHARVKIPSFQSSPTRIARPATTCWLNEAFSHRNHSRRSLQTSLLLRRRAFPSAWGSHGCTHAIGTTERSLSTLSKGSTSVRIGDVEHELGKDPPDAAWLLPTGYLPENPSQIVLKHLQWMMAKDNLKQDMLLIGPPGAGTLLRRRLALMYAEMTRREVEVLTLSSDVTESDLKQRRELVGSGGVAHVKFVDQAPVRAARNGRLLILDGIEKAERNVLPTLNNLLENREMHLEDGHFLVSPERFLELKDERAMESSFLLPTHKDFRVIAIGSPSPPYPGRSLDPPLRSRFQIRRIDPPKLEELYEKMLDSGAPEQDARQYTMFAGAIESLAAPDADGPSAQRTLNFPSNALESIAKVLRHFPREDRRSLLARAYPHGSGDKRVSSILGQRHGQSAESFSFACDQLDFEGSDRESRHPEYILRSVERNDTNTSLADVTFSLSPAVAGKPSINESTISIPCGQNELHQVSDEFVHTVGAKSVLKSMLQEHGAGRDILLLGPKGDGKTATAMEFSSILGYEFVAFSLYKEMAGRDLLQRRTTDKITGETTWEDSPMIRAALKGHVCILDGVDKLRDDCLSSLSSLMADRELSLPDGRKLVSAERFVQNRDAFPERNPSSFVLPIHSSFRVVALGSLSNDSRSSWLSEETTSMFSTLIVPAPTNKCLFEILKTANPRCPDKALKKIMKFHRSLTEATAHDCGVSTLSIRNLKRIVKRVSSAEERNAGLREIIFSLLLAELLPPTQRDTLESLLKKANIRAKPEGNADGELKVDVREETAHIGNFWIKRGKPRRPEMVPSPLFFDIPNHIRVIRDLLDEYKNGERAFLLLGNQGVGKNKIVDRICEICNIEREYIQLHRDSTISQLTLSPSLEDGKIVWHDSPLVRAATEGSFLVIDEADKAPVDVIAVLKALVEDGELLLADGRRISRRSSGDGIIEMHPDFTVWVLANRPGFPFLGNNLVREVGDCFSAHVVMNPDTQSEIDLLKSYAPSIDLNTLQKIAAAFADLRDLSDCGDLAYPYSTREAVSVVKHLERYPQDGLVSALHNVLDIDSFDTKLFLRISHVFQRHGVPLKGYSSLPTSARGDGLDDKAWQKLFRMSQSSISGGEGNTLSIKYSGTRSRDGISTKPPALSNPKLGKWDENNEAHVGGNQWAGGTGGSDTAGLGGRGGPYRLDRGHKVHQVSDEAKAQVSEEAAAAAREIAEKALAERLAEIGMSENEWTMYDRLVDPIRGEIASLRASLTSVEARRSEREWIKRQTHGEIDDSKIVDGATGDKHIFKRRGEPDASPVMTRPKRLRFVVDISGSMYRFNGYDERLNRCLEAAALVMESFDGMERRFEYSIVGHSGDSRCIKLVDFGKSPENAKERLKILQTMVAHTQFCQSGDNTIEAMEQALIDLKQANTVGEEPDESIVVLISDANLARYGIRPSELADAMEAGCRDNDHTKAYSIFIASFGREAEEIIKALPAGRGFVCMHTNELPRVVRDILATQIG